MYGRISVAPSEQSTQSSTAQSHENIGEHAHGAEELGRLIGPRDASASQIIDRLRPKLAAVQGIALFMQASQDINVGGCASRTQYQFTLQDSDLDELDHWAPILLRTLQGIPLLRDVATDQQIAGPTLRLEINRDTASRLGVATQAIDDTLL